MTEPEGAPLGERAPAPLWARATAPLLRFPWERTVVMAVAAVVGLYAGIAAGLFSTAIRSVQLLVYRGPDVFAALSGGDPGWGGLMRRRLEAAHWHLEFASFSALLLLFVALFEALGRRRLPLFEIRRLRAVAVAGALGLALYYPLLVLSIFNGTFSEREGGLYQALLEAPRLLWVLGPAFGALAAGLLVRYVSPESGGHGVVEVIEAVHVRGRTLLGRVALWKSLAAGLVIGSGGSAGREGPVVHLGGAVASSLSRFLELPRREAALLLACGAGAGIAASFQAPLAGSPFALEIVLGDFTVTRFTPIVLACVCATATSRALLGGQTEFLPVQWTLNHPSEIAVYLALGVAAGLTGVLYVRLVHGAEQVFAGHRGGALGRALSRLRPEWRAAAGGLAVGLLGLLAPRALGTGVESMNAALAGRLTLGVLALALVGKLLATSATLGSGAPGGSFFPAVFVGAMLGGAFGHLAQALLPGIVSGGAAYAAVGMGAVVAGATVAPLTGVLMMFELTGSYQIVLPLLVACGISAALANGILGGSIYTLGARRRGVRLSRGAPGLSELSVAQALERVPPLPPDLPLAELAETLRATPHLAFPVLDGATPLGALSVREARRALLEPGNGLGQTVRALARAVPLFLPDDDLDAAARALAAAGCTEGLVVAGAEILGIVTQAGILEAWRRATDSSG